MILFSDIRSQGTILITCHVLDFVKRNMKMENIQRFFFEQNWSINETKIIWTSWTETMHPWETNKR